MDGGRRRVELAHHGVFLVEWEAFFVGVAGAEDAEAVVEELGDEVLVRRSVPEGVDEGGAEGWLVVVEDGVCGRGWSIRRCSLFQLILDIVHRCASSRMDGVRIHVHKGKLNAGRRNVSGDRKDGGH